MLADLPPTPVPASPHKQKTQAFKLSSPKKSPLKAVHRSPRRSPAKNISVGKAGSGRKAHRVSRRSLASPSKVVSYDTELIPPLPAPAFAPLKPLGLATSSLLPNSFVLPPPSPHASLPTKPALPPPPESPPENDLAESDIPDYSPPMFEVSPPPEDLGGFKVPATPGAARRGFPVAKPFAQRMIHAYSPAKPSPLSRILMLADSPLTPANMLLAANTSLSPTTGPLETVSEDSFEEALLGVPSGVNPPRPQTPEPQMSLAEELGVSESPPDTPLQEKKVEPNVVAAAPPGRGGQVFFPEVVKKQPRTTGFTAAEKGKAKAEPPGLRAKTSALGEKENSNSRQKVFSSKAALVSAAPGTVAKKVPPATVTVKSSAKTQVKPVASSSAPRNKALSKHPAPTIAGGGPRRVPINSADAPTLGKGWKG